MTSSPQTKDAGATPMLRQYHALKSKHPDCILFFRLGDFYEMFYTDAETAAKELDLVLTARGKGTANKVPMCGFPHHSCENYIARLIKAGHKVAICEQTEDPAAAKGIVKRDIVRIITSGTYLDESDARTNYLLALSPNANSVGISFTDPAQGAIETNELPLNTNRVAELIAKLPVKECIFPENDERVAAIFDHPLLKLKNISLSPYQDWCFNPDIARKTLCEHFDIHNLSGFGIDGLDYAVSSTGALLEYLRAMNKQPLKHIDQIRLYNDADSCYISPAAHQGLELSRLISTLDETHTAAGRRKFAHWLHYPLKNSFEIVERQDAATLLKNNRDVQSALESLLKKIPDLEKNISRLSCGYVHARDLLALRNTLELLPELIETTTPLVSSSRFFQIDDLKDLREYLARSVNEDIPLSKPEGKIIREGFHDELDELRSILTDGRGWLKSLQEEEIKKTGINTLKIGFNKVFGYYIEVSKAQIKNVPQHYIRKQTLVNGERFITPELKTYEEKILNAEEKISKIEQELVREICVKILEESLPLHNFCDSIAVIDSINSLARLAARPGYIAPSLDESACIDIKAGRHPVVENSTDENFVPNDTYLNSEEKHCVILTGPNMAGKSTYIRQTAILTIMAQAGSYLPADSAKIGVVDKIFTRIGAHDDIAKGQSTFMVEMNETADILNNMTDRSLVILDEIGRGTSTYDGLSLAWALAEHLAGTKARTLFATHFHELTALADKFDGVANFNVAVKEWKDKIIFLHKIVPGSTNDSYGIYVAKLAGIPQRIITRSKHILTQLEMKNDIKENLGGAKREDQLNLFTAQADPAAEEIRDMLEEIDINTLTPIEALNRLKELKDKIDS